MAAKTKYYCKSCRKQLLPYETPCPKCGCVSLDISITIEDSIKPTDSLKGKVKSSDTLENKYTFKIERKISGETKLPAEDRLIIDRSHPDITIKKHKVKEKEKDRWKTVHNETKIYKAKRRKQVFKRLI